MDNSFILKARQKLFFNCIFCIKNLFKKNLVEMQRYFKEFLGNILHSVKNAKN